MFDSFKTSLFAWAVEMRDAFLWPGSALLAKIDTSVPWLVELSGIDVGDPATALVTAGIIWLAIGVAVTALLRFIRNLVRQVIAIAHALAFRSLVAVRGLKTKVVCAFRNTLYWRRSAGVAEPGLIEFDDLEIAILRYAAARGAGFALSAPELAESFSLRPSQVQRGIDGLAKNRMLDYALGETDGYDNYRLTDSGAAFLGVWDRQQAQSALGMHKQPA